MKCIYYSVEFEWDDGKCAANIRRRRIDFRDATRIFLGPVLEYPDDRYDYGEDRVIACGEAEGRVLVIVYTWRRDRRRIISARRATQNEAKDYYKAFYPESRQ